MDKKRTCKRCTSSLSEMDPHNICKSCRQPDPQMFYCSEDDCEACSVIKVYKPLDRFLRNQELENLTKKLNFSPLQMKHDKPVVHKKAPELFSKSHLTNFNSSFQERTSGINQEIMGTILKGIYKEKNENPFSAKPGGSYPSTSGNEGENFKDLEKRLFDKIMSNVMTTLSSDSKSSSPERFSNTPKPIPTKAPVLPKKSAIKTSYQKPAVPLSTSANSLDLDKTEEQLQEILVSLFSKVNPDSLAQVNKGGNENGDIDYVFKISSTASDILFNGTVLNSPLQATKLSEELYVENEDTYWPAQLNAADVLHSNFSKLPSMKLHPKVRHMHNLLFGKLNPSLPSDLFGPNFALPTVSLELKNECLFAREQLQRLLLMFSMADYFYSLEVVKENPSVATLLELLLNQLKTSIEKQANFVGLLIQEIRRDLLNDAECKEPEAITKLTMGPVNQHQFFGPYVKELQEIVNKKGSSYCLTSKSEANVNLFKLPSKFKEGESASKFIVSLRTFFESNATNEKDKPAILESLLPTPIIDRIINFIKPLKITDRSFEEIALTFEKLDQNYCSNFLLERHNFLRIKQAKGQSIKSYASMLETLIGKCMYGTCSREILRDQFVFGLQEENIQKYLLSHFSWSFEECVMYAMDPEQNGIEKPLKVKVNNGKRKVEPTEEGTSTSSKKLKLFQDTKAPTKFYNTLPISKSKNKILNVSSVQQWNNTFGFEVNYTFNVYCPWTGQLLRALA